MGKNIVPSYCLRIDKELKDKVKYIGEMNDRNLNNEIMHILKKYVADYEKEHGIIEIKKD